MRSMILAVIVLALVGANAHASTDFGTDALACATATETTFRNSNAAALTAGNRNVYAGYRQVSDINQNPIIAAYSAVTGEKMFCREDYETSGVDGRAEALHYNGTDVYVYIRVDGGFTGGPILDAASSNAQSWTRSIGPANSGNFAIIARLNPDNGDLTGAAFITAILSNGKSNSVGIKAVQCTSEGNVRVRADSFFSPRRIDGTAMTDNGAGGSPHDYTIDFTPDLTQVLYTSAVNWETLGTPSTVVTCPDSSLGPIGGNLDINSDNRITPADAIFVINRIGNTPTGNDAPADVDGDTAITVSDATAVIRQMGEEIP